MVLCGPDICYLHAFGGPGDKPVAGDWRGIGTAVKIAKIGIYRDNGGWMLDHNGSGTFDQCNVDQCYYFFGLSGDQLVVWNDTVVKGN